jgi:hypothetical protein
MSFNSHDKQIAVAIFDHFILSNINIYKWDPNNFPYHCFHSKDRYQV